MKKWLLTVIVCMLALAGCSKGKSVSEVPETEASVESLTEETETEPIVIAETEAPVPEKQRVKVKGIYISGYMAGSSGLDAILDKIEQTEINAVVIDVKNDDGRITFAMEGAPTVNEIGASQKFIGDIDGLMQKLEDRGIYTIARVVAFRDPYLAEQKPDWSLKNADGSLHRDNKGLAWVNPYKQEVWDYLVEVGTQAARVGFDEIQFDYIRFATDKTMKEVVFDEADTKGRSKTDIITEFITYAYDKLSAEDVFVGADVFGTIIGSKIDADAVGQIYNVMSQHLDYICPMIYPSHYGDGNFGIEHPDTQPYDTILAALQKSKQDLYLTRGEGDRQAIVRPWLQDFTASYLKHYIKYGPKEIRAQIQAVYDAGYDEWILWSASNKYSWDGLLSPEAAAEEEGKIAESRAALPPESYPEPETTAPVTSASEVNEADSNGAGQTEAGQVQSGDNQTAAADPFAEAAGSGETGQETITPVQTDKNQETEEPPAAETSGEDKKDAEKKEKKEKNKPKVVIVTTGAAEEY